MAAPRPPVLDDRDFEKLRLELLRRIPVHAPEWTDHNPSDPGIAILELFAWLTENLLYRLNRVPEASHLEFLRLLDLKPRPPTVARGFARLSTTDAQGFPVNLAFSPLEPRARAYAGKVAYQVAGEITVLPVDGVAAIKKELVGTVAGTANLLVLLGQSGMSATAEQIATYETLVLPPPMGDLPPAPTSFGQAIDGSLWVALLRPKAVTADLDAVRRRMSGQHLSIGVLVDGTLCGPADLECCPDPGETLARRDLEWQIGTGRFVSVGGTPQIDQPIYRRLQVVEDTTDGLTTSGVVRLALPATDNGGQAVFGDWARAGLPDEDLLGIGDLPPLLPDEKDEARVLTWVRCVARQDPKPRVRWVDVNVVEVEQAITAPPELLGRGTGQPGVVVRLSNAPVLARDLVIEVQEPAGWVVWRCVEDFGASKADDPHYTLDPATGEVRFGDGLFGRAPRRGEAIRARTYRHGGGAQGNVPAGALKSLDPGLPTTLKVTNPLPMSGGRDGETLDRARRRIPEFLRHRDRAVATDDFRSLALEAPGVDVGRVHVLPRHLPYVREDEVPGVVTVIVIPAFDALNPDTPTPDRAMLRAVCQHLEPRRLVTTELYVTPPEYVPIWVSVAVVPEEGFGVATVRQWVELAIRQYLAPLPPYGPGGEGWPFDRDVRPSDVAAAVLRVQGVRLVPETLVEGTEIGPDGTRTEIAASAPRVGLRAWQLPVVRGVQVLVTDDADAQAEPISRDEGADGPDRPDGLVPVPTERETC